MEELTQMHCKRVDANTPRLVEKEVARLTASLPGWKTVERDGELRLEKSFKFENFRQGVAFTYQIAQSADEEDHHPAILTEWGKVTVTWWTHRIKGLHLNDFIMAAKTDGLYENSTHSPAT